MKRIVIAIAIVALFGACKKKDEAGSGGSAASGAAPTDKAPTDKAPPPADKAAPPADNAAPPADKVAAPSGDRPASVTDEVVAFADKTLAAMEAMSNDLTAAGSDCAKGAAALRTGAEKLKPIMAEGKKLVDKDDQAAEEWFKKTYGERMMKAMGGMMTLAQGCATDKDFQAASEEFGNAMEM